MKLSLFFLLPIASVAFAPASRFATRTNGITVTRNELDDACEKIVSKTEECIEKADNLVLSRVMRFVDHAPILLSLKCLADKAGMACAKSGVITTSPTSFTGLGTALAVPTWCFNIWAVIAVTQLASVAKSALAEGGNELSQKDITSTATANFLAVRAVGSANPLRDTALTAIVSGYALRKNSGDGAVNVHKAAMQLMSSFTTVLAVLGVVSTVAGKLSFVNAQVTSVLGIVAYYAMATRGGNGTVKKAVNAGIIGGVVYARLAAGVSLSMDVASIVTGATTVGVAYVAYEAVNRLRTAVMQEA
jgi:hypothetical protein